MIILAATPIGNLQDASPRLVKALEEATLIAAEDTRNTQQLMRLLEIKNRPEIVSLNDHNESAKAAEIIRAASESDVLVVSDAGMPTVSDPGFKLVNEAIKNDVAVSIIPGPSAPLAALAVSGLPTDRFVFDGFVPRGEKEKLELARELCVQPRTTILFESAKRIAKTLQFLAVHVEPNRQAAVCRELTKMYEEVKRGTLQELYDWAKDGVKGEIVLVIDGAKPKFLDLAQSLEAVQKRVQKGERIKDAAKAVALASKATSSEIYNSYIAQTKGKDD